MVQFMTETIYTVRGMTCDHCVHAVTSALTQLAGVGTVEVDLDSGRARVISEAPLDERLVRAAVDEAGYEVTG